MHFDQHVTTGGTVNWRRLDLLSMHLAILCAQHGSLSAAARHAHLSLSGASHRLRELEDSLGYQLFTRKRYGLVITAEGAAAIACCSRVIANVHELYGNHSWP